LDSLIEPVSCVSLFFRGKEKKIREHEVIFLKKKKIPISDKDTTNVNEQSIVKKKLKFSGRKLVVMLSSNNKRFILSITKFSWCNSLASLPKYNVFMLSFCDYASSSVKITCAVPTWRYVLFSRQVKELALNSISLQVTMYYKNY